jgi:hypothetical protein
VKDTDWLKFGAVSVGWLTAATGATQCVLPGFVLGLLQAESTTTTRHFFSIVGMFMLLFGGLLVHASRSEAAAASSMLIWCGLQKLGASIAIGLGVLGGVFFQWAWLLAGFDLMSGVLIIVWRHHLGRTP